MTDEIKQRIVYVLTRTNKADDDDSDIYVGSTSKPLCKRLCNHRFDAQNPRNENNQLYIRMREVGLQNWEILPLLSRTCDVKTIRELERKWIGVLHADLNTRLPIREEETLKEYHANYGKDYYKENKGAIKQQQAKYYEKNKDAVRQRKAKYYEKNKDAVRQRKAGYHKKNIEDKRFYCDVCDLACVSNCDLKKHLDTLKHAYAWLNAVD